MWKPPFSRDSLNLPQNAMETERLLLRPFAPTDGEAFFAMDSDPRVADAIPIPVARDRKKYLAEFVTDLAGAERYKFFRAIALATEPETAIGWVYIRPTEDGEDVELGYRLIYSHWGKGIVPEACRTILALGFDQFKLDRVIGFTVPQNRNSKRVFEKLSFSQRGSKFIYNEDCLLFALENPGRQAED